MTVAETTSFQKLIQTIIAPPSPFPVPTVSVLFIEDIWTYPYKAKRLHPFTTAFKARDVETGRILTNCFRVKNQFALEVGERSVFDYDPYEKVFYDAQRGLYQFRKYVFVS